MIRRLLLSAIVLTLVAGALPALPRAQETVPADPVRVQAIADLMGQQVASRWFVPAGMQNADLVLTVEVALASDGRLTDYAFRAIDGDADATTRETLVRSVTRTLESFRTDPFAGLPREDYAVWQVFRLTFDPAALPR